VSASDIAFQPQARTHLNAPTQDPSRAARASCGWRGLRRWPPTPGAARQRSA
jgi:hypothetical protein